MSGNNMIPVTLINNPTLVKVWPEQPSAAKLSMPASFRSLQCIVEQALWWGTYTDSNGTVMASSQLIKKFQIQKSKILVQWLEFSQSTSGDKTVRLSMGVAEAILNDGSGVWQFILYTVTKDFHEPIWFEYLSGRRSIVGGLFKFLLPKQT